MFMIVYFCSAPLFKFSEELLTYKKCIPFADPPGHHETPAVHGKVRPPGRPNRQRSGHQHQQQRQQPKVDLNRQELPVPVDGRHPQRELQPAPGHDVLAVTGDPEPHPEGGGQRTERVHAQR